MSKPVIRRYFSAEDFSHIKKDCKFLVDKVVKSGFEYDLQIRHNYFNLYYRGNSLGKIRYVKRDKAYLVNINRKFAGDEIKKKFGGQPRSNNYLRFSLTPNRLRSFYRSVNLSAMARKVRDVNYHEETTFEQILITDNVGRTDLIIVDRQINQAESRGRQDLLALVQRRNNNYQFCAIEVKLGNNPELKGDVIEQLESYIKKISSYFGDYKKCYELNFSQKQELGLLQTELTPNIISEVSGLIVVGGYSGIASKSISELRRRRVPAAIKILQLKNLED